MFHKLGIKNDIDLPMQLFKFTSPSAAVVQQASIIRDGRIGPENGSSAGYNKHEVLIRATSEAIERRSSMIGSFSKKVDKKVKTWNVIKNKIDRLDREYTRMLEGKTDTTGSALHIKSSTAIENAVKELLEKNALFLFWYGKMGYRIEEKYYLDNEYFNILSSAGFKTKVFINNYFEPLHTLFVISHKDNDLFLCGLGSHTNPLIALKHAFEEAYLIGYMQYYALSIGIKPDENLWWTEEKERHIEKLAEIETVELNSIFYEDFNLNNIIQNLPKFIEDLHIIYLEQSLSKKLKGVRVYSKDLINCLPLKKNINISISLNQNTIQLSKEELLNYPECPMC